MLVLVEVPLPAPTFIPVIRQIAYNCVGNFSGSTCYHPYRIQCTSTGERVVIGNSKDIIIYNANEVDFKRHLSITGTTNVLDIECSGGKVYVADGTRDRGGVFVYCESSGKLIQWIPIGYPDNKDTGAVGIAITENMLYVASSIDSKVIGMPLMAWNETKIYQFISKTECTELEKPQYIAATSDLVVVSCAGHKVLLFNTKADLQGIYGTGVPGSEMGQLKHPTGVLFDPKGNIIIVDSGNNRLCVMSAKAKHLTSFSFGTSRIQSQKIAFNKKKELIIAHGKLAEHYEFRYAVYTFEYKHYTIEALSTLIPLPKAAQHKTIARATQTSKTVIPDQITDTIILPSEQHNTVMQKSKWNGRKESSLPEWLYRVAGFCICSLVSLYIYQYGTIHIHHMCQPFCPGI